MKYTAIWQINSKEVLVLPRSKKRWTFDSVEQAQRALEQRARRAAINSRGLIKEATSGVVVLHIAL